MSAALHMPKAYILIGSTFGRRSMDDTPSSSPILHLVGEGQLRIKCLVQGHNTAPTRIEPRALRSKAQRSHYSDIRPPCTTRVYMTNLKSSSESVIIELRLD